MSEYSAAPHDSAATLPPHSIRRSKRARRIALRVLPGKGLEVVLPCHVDPACVPDILARNRCWIERALRRIHEREAAGNFALQENFLLKGGREVAVLHRIPPSAAPGKRGGAVHEIQAPPENPEAAHDNRQALYLEQNLAAVLRQAKPPAISLTSPITCVRHLRLPQGSPETILPLLKGWIRQEAAVWLEPMLADMAGAGGFAYTSVNFRFQKSRWGSCTARGRINLNACLLFLPERLARYILLHELCHTRVLNHSPAFWKQVFTMDPEAMVKDKAMRAAWKYVPNWIWS